MTSKADQVGVRHLTESDESLVRNERIVRVRNLVGQKSVIASPREFRKHGRCLPYRDCVSGDHRVR